MRNEIQGTLQNLIPKEILMVPSLTGTQSWWLLKLHQYKPPELKQMSLCSNFKAVKFNSIPYLMADLNILAVPSGWHMWYK